MSEFISQPEERSRSIAEHNVATADNLSVLFNAIRGLYGPDGEKITAHLHELYTNKVTRHKEPSEEELASVPEAYGIRKKFIELMEEVGQEKSDTDEDPRAGALQQIAESFRDKETPWRRK